MKKTGLVRNRVVKILILALIIAISVTALTACSLFGSTKKVKSIAVKEDTVKGYYVLNEFDVSSIQLAVTYDDDTEGNVNVGKYMLSAEASEELKTAGEKNLTITYKGATATLKIVLVEDGATIANVVFYDKSGTTVLSSKYTVIGGSVEAPTPPAVEGMQFSGWVDKDNNVVDLTKIPSGINVFASYSASKTTYTVKFVDPDGKVLKSGQYAANTQLKTSDAPKVNLSDYPYMESFSWSPALPVTVTGNTNVSMAIVKKQFIVTFKYAKESSPDNFILLDKYTMTAEYGQDVSADKQKAEQELAENGFEIVTAPTVSTSVKSNSEFKYVVRDASVALTVYLDAEKTRTYPLSVSTMKTGTVFTFPDSSAATVAGYTLKGWRVESKTDASVFEEFTGESWTVNKQYGINVIIYPVYAPRTVEVEFVFDFIEKRIADDATQTYKLTIKLPNVFAQGDAVTYEDANGLFETLKANADAYLKQLNGESVASTTVKGVATDNSSSARKTVFKEDTLDIYGISDLTVGEERIRPGSGKTLTSSGVKFVVGMTAETKGIEWGEIKDGKGKVVAYEVKGYGGSSDVNIFIPDNHKGEADDKALPVEKIGADAFNNGDLVITRIPSGIKRIETNAFKDSTIFGDIKLPSLTYIGKNAFNGVTFLGKTVTFGALTEISEEAFASFRAEDATINIHLDKPTTTEKVDGKDVVKKIPVSIKERAFADAKGITTINLTENVVSIGKNAFVNTGITAISGLGGTEIVGEGAFDGTALAEIDLPKAKTIGEKAFANNPALMSLSIGSSAGETSTSFNFNALEGSTNIEKIAFGKYVTEIIEDENVFAAVQNLSTVTVAKENKVYSSHENVLYKLIGDKTYELIYYPAEKTGNYKVQVGASDAKLKLNAKKFANAIIALLDLTGLGKNVELSETTNTVYSVAVDATLKESAKTAFNGALIVTAASESTICYDEKSELIYEKIEKNYTEEPPVNKEYDRARIIAGNRKATEITIPEKIGGLEVVSVKNGAFASYAFLEKLTINATLESWNNSILDGDDALKEFTVKAWKSPYKPVLTDVQGNGWYKRNNVIFLGGEVIGYNNSAEIGGIKITEVTAEDAAKYFAKGIPAMFFSGSNVTKVSLPSSVKVVNEKAFANCRNLISFTAENLTFVGDGAFMNCIALEEMTLNFVGENARMQQGVFSGCTSLKKATINGKINANRTGGVVYYSIPAKTFENCVSLTEANLGDVNNFAKDEQGASYAFDGCTLLASFDFEKIIGNEIPAGAFRNCTSLTYAMLVTSSLEKVGQEAFAQCSALIYVRFGASVTEIGIAAFAGCNNALFELAYDNGGLFSDDAKVEVGEGKSFEDAAQFFVSDNTDISEIEFLKNKKIERSYPVISFEVTSSTDSSLNFSMGELQSTMFLKEGDLVAPTYAGYTFEGWYFEKKEQNAVSFPIVVSRIGENKLYAKYYNEKQGSLNASTDVKYVYYVGSAPEVKLNAGETATWKYIRNNGTVETNVKFPLVVDIERNEEITLICEISIKANNSLETTIVAVKEFENPGRAGYAITHYSGNNADRVKIPSVFDDAYNGEADVIVLYAGAFGSCVPEDFIVPDRVQAILKGHYDTDKKTFYTGTTFGNGLKYVTIPKSVEYIEDGVFVGGNIEAIVFEEDSNLVNVTAGAFAGSKWWQSQVVKASEHSGFVLAGRTAIRFIGTADAAEVDESGRAEVTTTRTFGFVKTDKPFDIYITIYYKDGTSETVTQSNVVADAALIESGVYKFSIDARTAKGTAVNGIFAINSQDTAKFTFVEGKNVLYANASAGKGVIAISIASSKDEEVSLPEGTIKLADDIFKGNAMLKTIILNKELRIIGNQAFAMSGLTTVRYGATNTEQYLSSVEKIGQKAFDKTAWYTKNEKVILGTRFLKYNNVSGATAITITESITSIEDEAFANASSLTAINISASTLKYIGAFAFKNSNIVSIVLPASVESMARGAFYDCKGLENADLSKTKLTLLADETFYKNVKLVDVKLADSVKTIGNNAFAQCASLAEIKANGISELTVLNGNFASGLEDTIWYKADRAEEKEEDTALVLGSVLVKYVVGKQAFQILAETNKMTVVVPDGITVIAYKAFNEKGVDSVTEIVLLESVIEIGEYAFVGCKSLTTIQFGSKIKTIGARAFANLNGLTTAVLPDGLEKIGDEAFMNTALATEIRDENGIRVSDEGYSIPDSVTEIGASAFYGVNTLTVINLGSGLTNIGANAFNTVRKNGDDMLSEGNLYKVNWNLDIQEPATENNEIKPAPINVLAKNIANGQNGTTIFATDANKKIRFYVSQQVVEYIDDSKKFEYKDNWAQYKWEFFVTGTLPEIIPTNDHYKIDSIRKEYLVEGDLPQPPHFTDNDNTYTFMYWVEVMADSKEKRLVYPYVVTQDLKINAKYYANEIPDATKKDDNETTFETIDTGTGAVAISGFAFTEDVERDTLYIPNKINGSIVSAISMKSDDDKIKKLVITNASNFNGMSENVFRRFTALESIELHLAGAETADYKVEPVTLTAQYEDKTYEYVVYALYSADVAADKTYGTKLISVIGNIESATKAAQEKGYEGKDLLDFEFVIPEGVTEILDGAMINCNFKTVRIPSTITAIGTNAFGSNLERLRMPKTISLTDVTKDSIKDTAPIMKAKAGNPVVSADYVEINGLKEPNGNYGDFYAIGNVLVGYETSIRKYNLLALPNAVNGIEITVLAGNIYYDASAENQINAETISLPNNVYMICGDAFNGINFDKVSGAESYSKLEKIASNVFNETSFYKDNNGTEGVYVGKILVKWQAATENPIIRADTIAISSDAFKGSKVVNVVIPDSVRSIGDNAFYNCVNLKSVTIPNGVVSIGDGAFLNCNALEEVKIDTIGSNLASIGKNAFARATSLKTLRLPYNLKSIGDSAFNECKSLVTISFDGYDEATGEFDETKRGQLIELGGRAFLGATNLTEIKIPDGITVIKESTFERCSSLVKVNFGVNSKLKEIEASAFSECVKLGSMITIPENYNTEKGRLNASLITVEMPNSLIKVGAKAFYGCHGMWGIGFGYNLASIGSEAFANCRNLAKVEIRRATAPTITNNTFDLSGNYRLRIYVGRDEGKKTKKTYVEAWNQAWNACEKYIYEIGDRPKITFKNTKGAIVECEAEVMISPSINFGDGEISSWKYESLQQIGENPIRRTKADGSDANVKDYGNQTYVLGDQTFYLLVADYDEIVMAMDVTGN